MLRPDRDLLALHGHTQLWTLSLQMIPHRRLQSTQLAVHGSIKGLRRYYPACMKLPLSEKNSKVGEVKRIAQTARGSE